MKFKKLLPKAFFWSIMKMATRKNTHKLSQGPPNPGFMQEKVQKEEIFFSCFSFLWRPGTLNWERVVFLPSKNLYRKCELTSTNMYHTIFRYLRNYSINGGRSPVLNKANWYYQATNKSYLSAKYQIFGLRCLQALLSGHRMVTSAARNQIWSR